MKKNLWFSEPQIKRFAGSKNEVYKYKVFVHSKIIDFRKFLPALIFGAPKILIFEGFILAGFCEIGGGYLIWLWLREGGSFWIAILGGIIRVLYGIVATFQPANFGRVYAAYGGVFIVMAIIWGWQVDKVIPDRFDIIGGIIALIGMAVIMYWPRN